MIGVGQLRAGDRLRHVAAGAGTHDGDHVLGGVGDREGQEALRGRGLGDPADHLDSSAARHVDVEQNDVGLRFA